MSDLVNLSGVQTSEWEAGEYTVTCTNAEMKETKNGMGKYIKVEFSTPNGRKLWNMFNIINAKEEAEKIGLQQLKSFLKASGHHNPDALKDLQELLNLRCIAKVKIEESDYGTQPRISYFKPMAGAKAPGPAPGNIPHF